MKNKTLKISCLALFMAVGIFSLMSTNIAKAEDNNEASELIKAATSISISPVNKVLQLEPSTVYEDSFKITNSGSESIKFEVYASPYSYTFSESDNEYRLGFSNENTYTQITRWITFMDSNGNFVKSPQFTAEPGESVEITYHISTPSSIPAGGQYAVLFAHTLSDASKSGGIRTEASPGLVIYGRSLSETVVSGEISDLTIDKSIQIDGENKNIINASAKVKNTGNIDFMGIGKLKVEGIFGQAYYETPQNQGKVSVIPESELVVSDKWDDTPYFGLFKATWTVSAAKESETISKVILILPMPIIVIAISLLTIITIWIIIMVKKRRERRSRFMV